MSIFDLAVIELQREGIRPDNPKFLGLVIDRAKTIRHYIDIQERNKKIAQARYAKKNFVMV